MNLEKLKALVLVGGLGTRLREVVDEVPKPMAPVNEKPFLYYKIFQMKNAGIKNFVFLVGYKHEIIQNYFSDGKDFGISIEYSIEKELLGTAGAIKNAEEFIDKNTPFFVCNGDTFLFIDFLSMLNQYLSKNALYMMLLTSTYSFQQVGYVNINENLEIINFIEKPDENTLKSLKTTLINAGVYLLSPKILDLIPPKQKCSIERDIFPKLVGINKKFYGFIYPKENYFIDIGIPRNYNKFIEDIKLKKIKLT